MASICLQLLILHAQKVVENDIKKSTIRHESAFKRRCENRLAYVAKGRNMGVATVFFEELRQSYTDDGST